MHAESKQTAEDVERLIVIDVLNRPRGRERTRLYRTLDHFDQAAVDAAIGRLEQAGVIVTQGSKVRASPALTRLERLDLIGI
jgi:hypothetical protein